MPDLLGSASPLSGGRRGVSVKTLKRMLKKAGLKTTGRKAALTRRAKKAHLKMRGGEDPAMPEEKKQDVQDGQEGMGRRRRHRSRKH